LWDDEREGEGGKEGGELKGRKEERLKGGDG